MKFGDITLRQLGSSVWKGLKYSLFFLLVGLLVHLIRGSHPGMFEEFYWHTMGVFIGVVAYDLRVLEND